MRVMRLTKNLTAEKSFAVYHITESVKLNHFEITNVANYNHINRLKF
jgi:hypothetical protein